MANYDFKNEVELTGKVCEGLKENVTKSGLAVLDFSLNIQVSTQVTNPESGMTEPGESKNGYVNCTLFCKKEKVEDAKQILTRGAIVTASGRISPEQWMKDGREQHSFKLVLNDIKPYEKSREGEKTNHRNNVRISGFVTSDPSFIGKDKRFMVFDIAVNEGKDDNRRTHFFQVTKRFKEEDRSMYEQTVRKGQALTVGGRFNPHEYTSQAGNSVKVMRIEAFQIEHAQEKSADGLAETKAQETFDKAQAIEKNPELAGCLKGAGIDPMTLSDKQVQRMFWFHSPLMLNTPNGRANFIPEKSEEGNWSLKVDYNVNESHANQETAER